MAISEIYAEDMNYWKSSQSSPDTWIERAKKQIAALPSGKVTGEAFGSSNGSGAYVLAFEIGADRFKVIWPVLPSRTKNEKAAKVQAATLLFHDVKYRCVIAKVFGVRTAFFNFLLLPDGRTAGEVASPELFEQLPRLLSAPGEAIEAEIIE